MHFYVSCHFGEKESVYKVCYCYWRYMYNDDNDDDANDNDDDDDNDDERKRCHDKRSLRALETINGISWHSLAGLHSIP